ncbi:unnamed protein product [Leuciscus chuanchicus]
MLNSSPARPQRQRLLRPLHGNSHCEKTQVTPDCSSATNGTAELASSWGEHLSTDYNRSTLMLMRLRGRSGFIPPLPVLGVTWEKYGWTFILPPLTTFPELLEKQFSSFSWNVVISSLKKCQATAAHVSFHQQRREREAERADGEKWELSKSIAGPFCLIKQQRRQSIPGRGYFSSALLEELYDIK